MCTFHVYQLRLENKVPRKILFCLFNVMFLFTFCPVNPVHNRTVWSCRVIC